MPRRQRLLDEGVQHRVTQQADVECSEQSGVDDMFATREIDEDAP